MATKFRALDRIAEVPREAWDALLDVAANPFTRFDWLEAMEASGAASPKHGWVPRHLTLWRGETLVAAAPAYVKGSSDGDFARDWDWASVCARAGLAYYPKLSVTVPFTPCTGSRFLVAPGEDRAAAIAALLDGARALAQAEGLSNLQVLFPTEDETVALEALGLGRRVNVQFHWRNRGYHAMQDFLAALDSKRRTMVRREMAEPAKQGIALSTVRVGELPQGERAGWAKQAHALHRSTVDKLMWGRGWLNERFYQRIFERMPEACEVVAATREGKLVAGAFNVVSAQRLYGRYWGCFEEHRFLHFNVCLYHSIDDCIRRGFAAFEGGAGGEHKITRGFEPTETTSAHLFFDEKAERALMPLLAEETALRHEEIAAWRRASAVLKDEKRAAEASR